MPQQERVLFIHAHPDDETISTGGTIARLVAAGAAVTVVTCTRGERGEIIPADLLHLLNDEDGLARYRADEVKRAMDILGVPDHRFLGDPDARWSNRPARRYLDSGMRWGENGAEPGDELHPGALTAADFGEVAADIAAVIAQVQPDVVVSYNERGGYGHPDHIYAHQTARRAAEVYSVPFFAVEPAESASSATMAVDVTDVLPLKRAALEAHRTQVRVEGENFFLSNGQAQPIESVEYVRRLHREPTAAEQRRSSWTLRILGFLLSVVLGLAVGAMLTVFSQSSLTIASTPVPVGVLVSGLLAVGLLVALRLIGSSRLVAAGTALGMLAATVVLSQPSAGGSVLAPVNFATYAWPSILVLTAAIVLGWPQTNRPRAGRVGSPAVVKGSPHQ